MNAVSERKFVAPGRGAVAQSKGPVRLRFIEDGRGTFIELGVDYERAEVPDRRYFADYCRVVEARAGIGLVFGRLAPGNAALRTKVEISYPETLFVRGLWNSSRAFHESLQNDFSTKRLAPIPEPQDTEKVQGFRANNVFMAAIGDDSIMDFYYIAPPDIHFVRIGRRADVYLEPIIRIALPTALMLEFLEQCKPHAERLHHFAEEVRQS
ncbi:MAG: hypothetical protein ABSG26_01090 [Bryobacteraceae bacterium]